MTIDDYYAEAERQEEILCSLGYNEKQINKIRVEACDRNNGGGYENEMAELQGLVVFLSELKKAGAEC